MNTKQWNSTKWRILINSTRRSLVHRANKNGKPFTLIGYAMTKTNRVIRPNQLEHILLRVPFTKSTRKLMKSTDQRQSMFSTQRQNSKGKWKLQTILRVLTKTRSRFKVDFLSNLLMLALGGYIKNGLGILAYDGSGTYILNRLMRLLEAVRSLKKLAHLKVRYRFWLLALQYICIVFWISASFDKISKKRSQHRGLCRNWEGYSWAHRWWHAIPHA